MWNIYKKKLLQRKNKQLNVFLLVACVLPVNTSAKKSQASRFRPAPPPTPPPLQYFPELASKLPTHCNHSWCFTTQRYDYGSTYLKETAFPLLLYGLSDGTSAHVVFCLKLLEDRRHY